MGKRNITDIDDHGEATRGKSIHALFIKLREFLYYNAIQLLFTLIAIIVLAVIVINRPQKYDFQLALVVAGEGGVPVAHAIEEAFDPYLYDHQSGQTVEFKVVSFDITESLRANNPKAQEKNVKYLDDGIARGKYNLFLMDQEAYESYKSYMVPVALDTETSFNSIDGIGWSWSGTDLFINANTGFLQEELIFCVRNSSDLAGDALDRTKVAQRLFIRVLKGERSYHK